MDGDNKRREAFGGGLWGVLTVPDKASFRVITYENRQSYIFYTTEFELEALEKLKDFDRVVWNDTEMSYRESLNDIGRDYFARAYGLIHFNYVTKLDDIDLGKFFK